MSAHTKNGDSSWLGTAACMVRQGDVIALPFERLFGLAANALDPTAVAEVAAIKERPGNTSGPQPISVILPSLSAVSRVAIDITPLASRLMNSYWPGLLTILVRAQPHVPPPLVSREGLIGIRLPGPSKAATLATHTDLVLTATSANEKGQKDALGDKDLANLIGPALVVQGSVPGPPGSTVVDASSTYPVVIREGFISLKEVT